MNITCCEKICNECGFIKSGTTDTLYAEAKDIISRGTIFPCHLYLKSKTGHEHKGTETLDKVKVCRGFVAYMKMYNPQVALFQPIWDKLFDDITIDDMKDIYSPEELVESHFHLKNNIKLGNQI